MTFAAEKLPDGLKLDESTGQITGKIDQPGEFVVTLSAKNDKGTDQKSLKIVIGDRIALTPPLGWNSWNCWAGAVDQEKVLHSAQAMVRSGLVNHGWTYINIDDTWQGPRGGEFHGIQPNEKFPDIKALCAQVHAMGMKIGIYSTPWTTSYAGYIGGSADNSEGTWKKPANRDEHVAGQKHGQYPFATNDAKQWAAWGFDYLKYDWHPNDVTHVSEMSKALIDSGRDIIYSLSNSAPFEHAADWVKLANCWRTTGDIVDNWRSMSGIGFSQDRWVPSGGPGHWNDPDMLVVGWVGWGPQLHPTHLSPNEQYTHISLWSLLAAPMLIGCDLDKLDDFTLNLLSNDEVLAVDQDELGQPAHRISVNGKTRGLGAKAGRRLDGRGFVQPRKGEREGVSFVERSEDRRQANRPRPVAAEGRWSLRESIRDRRSAPRRGAGKDLGSTIIAVRESGTETFEEFRRCDRIDTALR